MTAAPCAVCNKTAYPLESVTALEKVYHKLCFKCSVCKQPLSIKNFKGLEGKIYCAPHTPKPTSTPVTDSVALKQALNAPKKTSEGLGTVQKGIGKTAGQPPTTGQSVTTQQTTEETTAAEEPPAEYAGEEEEVYGEEEEVNE